MTADTHATRDLFVPGRLCLFGEHSDWAGQYRCEFPEIESGHCLISGTDQGLYATIKPLNNQFVIRSVQPNGNPLGAAKIPLTADHLLNAAYANQFESYAAGTAYTIIKKYKTRGIEIDIHTMDLPLKKGLSSSAAICVLTVQAFNISYQLNLSTEEEMYLAYKGEILTGSLCGRMDQACAYGRIPTALTFDGDSMTIETLKPGKTLHLLIVDLMSQKNTRRILSDLNSTFLESDTVNGKKIRQGLGKLNTEITAAAETAITTGDARFLGELMSKAQFIFDRFVAPACPAELDAPALHYLLQHPLITSNILGGKGVGSQGDGCVQLIVDSPDKRHYLMEKILSELGLPSLPLTINPAA